MTLVINVVIYAAIVPPLALTALIALAQTFVGDFSEQGQ